ncbi:MAG TPA: hypothetical protein VFW87_17095 [Pirellulales bacterium]|nr:hypothetical protein [Pirellulales bacterium]
MASTCRSVFTLMSAGALAITLGAVAGGNEGDDTLRGYLAKSDLVLVGHIQSEPFGLSSELDVVRYHFDFKVSSVLKGDVTTDQTFPVRIVRFESVRDDELPWMSKGAKAILFLRKAPDGSHPRWVSADVWFGIQPANSQMERSLKQLAAAAKKQRAENAGRRPCK